MNCTMTLERWGGGREVEGVGLHWRELGNDCGRRMDIGWDWDKIKKYIFIFCFKINGLFYYAIYAKFHKLTYKNTKFSILILVNLTMSLPF